MSNRNDPCERCGQVPFWDGHLPWCKLIEVLEGRIEELERQIEVLFYERRGE